MRLLDLFCGRWGWSRAFAARGWDCVGVDLVESPAPENCEFYHGDVLKLDFWDGVVFLDERCIGEFDFITASSPCEQFSVYGMPHFHKSPPYPDTGIRLFNHARSLAEAAETPYVMENVRSAERFLGPAIHHCGPFYLWGNAVPPLLPRGIKKGFQTGGTIIQKLKRIDRQALTDYRRQNDGSWSSSGSAKRKEWTAKMATIPPELANCVADYAEALLRGAPADLER